MLLGTRTKIITKTTTTRTSRRKATSSSPPSSAPLWQGSGGSSGGGGKRGKANHVVVVERTTMATTRATPLRNGGGKGSNSNNNSSNNTNNNTVRRRWYASPLPPPSTVLLLLLLLSSWQSRPHRPSSMAQAKTCIVMSEEEIFCTDNRVKAKEAADEARRRRGDSAEGGQEQEEPVFEADPRLDLGVTQRIDGNERRQVAEVLAKAEAYIRNEVMVESRYKKVRMKCKNKNELCAFWAHIGECQKNPSFMLTNCAPVCQSCLKLLEADKEL